MAVHSGKDGIELTERQLEVLERVVQRKAYKVIAAELDISETRVKQHVRTIKDRLNANTMPELVEHYHALTASSPFTNGVGPKRELPAGAKDGHEFEQGELGSFELADSVTMELHAPWLFGREPQVVPRALDGENAGLSRLLVIVGIVLGILAAIVLTLTAASALTEQFNGTGLAPREKTS